MFAFQSVWSECLNVAMKKRELSPSITSSEAGGPVRVTFGVLFSSVHEAEPSRAAIVCCMHPHHRVTVVLPDLINNGPCTGGKCGQNGVGGIGGIRIPPKTKARAGYDPERATDSRILETNPPIMCTIGADNTRCVSPPVVITNSSDDAVPSTASSTID